MTARWSLCLAALAVAMTACSREGDQPAAAPREVAPFATMPPPAEAAPASTAAADPAARDAALSAALVGRWVVPGSRDDDFKLVVTYRANGTVSTVVVSKDRQLGPYLGNWSIAGGVLTATVTIDGKLERDANEIVRFEADQFVYLDADNKKSLIATRYTGPAPDAVATQPAPPPVDEGTVFADETIFVAEKDTQAHVINLAERAQLRLIVDIDEKVPVNVVFQRGKVSPEAYVFAVGMAQLGPVLDAINDSDKKTPTVEDIFAGRLSKRAAYGHYASPWVTLPAGTYTVILDNSGEVSPSRGDAPTRLRLYARTAP